MADLTPKQEKNFQGWARSLPWFSEFKKQYGEEPNLDDKGYDYRAAWIAGIQPQRYGPDNGKYHWPSTTTEGTELKARNHPTAWMNDYMTISGGQDPMGAVNKLSVDKNQQIMNMLMYRYGDGR